MIWQDSMQRQRAQQSAIASKPGSMWSRFGFILLMVIHHILAFLPLLTFALGAMSHTRPKFDQYDLLYRQYISAMLIVGDIACLGFLPFLLLTWILWRKYRPPWPLCLVGLYFLGWFLGGMIYVD